MEESLENLSISISPCSAISILKGEEINLSAWSGLIETARELVHHYDPIDHHKWSYHLPWSSRQPAVVSGKVKLLKGTKDNYFVAIQTAVPVSKNHDNKFGIPRDHALFLPVEFVAANFVKEQIQTLSPYEMTSRPHGLALVLTTSSSKSSEGAYTFLKLFEYLQYSVQYYTFKDGSEFIELAKQISLIEHKQFDSFACYISFDEDTSRLEEFFDMINDCPSLKRKPKLFFIKSKFPLPLPTTLHEDFFTMTTLDVETNKFEEICYHVFTQAPKDDVVSTATTVSALKCITEKDFNEEKAAYTIKSQLDKPVYFFKTSEILGDVDSEILKDDKLSHIRITTRCSYVSITGPPSSGKSLVTKMLCNEPMLIKHDTPSIVFLPEIKATSLIALDKNDLSQPFNVLNTDLLLLAAKNKMQESTQSEISAVTRSLTSRPTRRLRPTSFKATAMHLVHIVNSGSHPFFLDLFSHLLKHHSFNIFTHKLSESLDEEIKFSCTIDGQVYPAPQNLNMTNFDYLRELARSLSDTSSRENPSLLVLGTIVNDFVSTQIEDTKFEELTQMLEQFENLSQIYTEDEDIFKLNATMKEEPLARKIRQKICKSYIEEDIPIRWFLFQHELVKHQKISGQNIVNISFCFKIGDDLQMDEEEVKKALECFSNMTIFLYFPKILQEIVFLHPQPILDKLSEISCISDLNIVKKLPTKRAIFLRAHEQLKYKGLFEQELLFHHLSNGFSNLFTPQDFLTLMSHLSIIKSLPKEGMLFFPKVLPEIEHAKIPFLESEVIPIIFNWRKRLIPKSLYVKLIHQLLSRQSFPTFAFLGSTHPIQQYRNAIYLKVSEIDGSVVIIDTLKWLEVHYTGQAQSRKCFLIKKAIFDALEKILQNDEYPSHKFSEIQQCFFCEHSTPERLHLCLLSKDETILTCCSDGVTTWSTDKKQELWLTTEHGSDYSILMARALANDSVIVTLTKLIIFGPPKSGKSSVQKLLLNEDIHRSRRHRFFPGSNTLDEISDAKTTLASITDQNWSEKIPDLSGANINLAFMIESGSDATFLDIVPTMMGSNYTVLYTQPLDTRFEEKLTFHYNVNGEIIDESKEFEFTYLGLLQETLRHLYSAKVFGKNITDASPFLIVGTRDDLQMKVFKRAIGEGAIDKSETIQSTCHHYSKMFVKYREDRGKIIFPVNCFSRDERELEIAARLRDIISKCKTEIRVPIKWYKFALHLQELSKTTDLIDMLQCIEIGTDYGLNKDSVHAALRFFDESSILRYFPAILPEAIFLRPQLLLMKLSELISVGFPKMASLTYRKLPPGAHENMHKYGIFERSLFKDFLSKGFSHVFTIDGFLALMERWSIISPLKDNKYFLLRALPINNASLKSLQETFTKESDTLLLTWDTPIPREIFLEIFINLINRESKGGVTPYFKYSQQDGVQQFRNALQLSCHTDGGNVLLVDGIERIEVSYSGPTSNCCLIRDAVTLAITDAIKKLGYSLDVCKYHMCFYCTEHLWDDDIHICYLNEEKQEVTCSKSMKPTGASKRQKYWLKPIFNYSLHTPRVTDLQNLLHRFSSHWYEIGLYLQVPDAALRSIQYRSMSSEMKLSLVFQKWRDNGSLITWQDVLDMVSRPPISTPSLSQNIQKIVEKSIDDYGITNKHITLESPPEISSRSLPEFCLRPPPTRSILRQTSTGNSRTATLTSMRHGSIDSEDPWMSPKSPSFNETLTDKQLREVARLIDPDIMEELCAYLNVEDYVKGLRYKNKILLMYKMLKKWIENKPYDDVKDELIRILDDMECNEAKEWLEKTNY